MQTKLLISSLFVAATVALIAPRSSFSQSYPVDSPQCAVELGNVRQTISTLKKRNDEMNQATAEAEVKNAGPDVLAAKMRSYAEAKLDLYIAFKKLRDIGYCGQTAAGIDGALRDFESGPFGKLAKDRGL